MLLESSLHRKTRKSSDPHMQEGQHRPGNARAISLRAFTHLAYQSVIVAGLRLPHDVEPPAGIRQRIVVLLASTLSNHGWGHAWVTYTSPRETHTHKNKNSRTSPQKHFNNQHTRKRGDRRLKMNDKYVLRKKKMKKK